jgi:benzoyl-CoA reductase/2-hydroxyglutaryl-CoA dehydratase subunit BcrC/BadD/HgdB
MFMKTFAYFDSGHEFPEEIVMAAGFTPMKILGDVHKGTAAADEYLFPFFCPFARGCLADALANSENWDGIGVAHGCDATDHHYDMWRGHVRGAPIFWVNSPMKTDKTAQTFYRRELKRFIENLDKQYQIKIGDKELQDAIRLSNQIKFLMQKLASLRAKKDIPNREYFEMTRKAVQTPKKLLIEDMKKMLAEWEGRRAFPAEKVPILLTGSDVTFVEWMDLLDTAGFRVVRDDLSLGERYFSTSIPDTDDPVEALVTYSVEMPRSATRVPSDGRLDYLLKALDAAKIGAVISQNMKFCEVYAMDSVWIVSTMKAKGHDVIHLERDYTPTEDFQLLTRLEAFREIIEQKGGRRNV